MRASRPSGAAIAALPTAPAGWTNDIVVVVIGIVHSILALGFAFHPLVIGVPVFGHG